MNLSPQKSKTIHDYRQNQWQADTEQRAPAEAAASPVLLLTPRAAIPPEKWGLDFGFEALSVWLVFTVTSGKLFNRPLQGIQLSPTGKMSDGEKWGGWGDSERVGSLFPNLCPWRILSLKYTSERSGEEASAEFAH